jgi:hypothetical protein
MGVSGNMAKIRVGRSGVFKKLFHRIIIVFSVHFA